MAHINPTTGSWEPDDDGPAPSQAGLVGEQAAPVPQPVPLPVTAPPALPANLPPVQLPEPQLGMPPGGPPPALPAGVPDVAPYQPQPAALPAVDRVVSPAERATLDQINQNTGARAMTEQQGGELDKAGAQSKLDAAQRDEAAIAERDKQRAQIEADYQKRLDAANAKAQADYQAYREMGIKDPEADQSFGHKLLAAIAIGLGQYSAGINGGPNQALNIIQTANSNNIARQKEAIEKKLKEAELSGRDAADVEKERAEAYRNLDLKHAALLESSAGMLRTKLAGIGVPAAQIAMNADIQKLEAEALQRREGVMENIRKDETSLARADIAAAARKKHVGGGGGGADAMAKFVEAAGALKPGDPIPPALAVLGRQAGLKPNQVASEVDRYRNSGAKAAAAGAGADRQESKEANDWAKQNGLAAISKQQRELGELQKVITDNAHNPLAQALAIEKAVAVARQGAASRQALSLALQHMGSSLDSAEGWIQQIKTGELPKGKMQNFISFLNGQRGAAQAEGKKAYDNFNKYATALPADQQARALQSRSRLFSGLDGFGGAAAEAGPGPDKVALAKKALADPNAPPAAKKKAAEILQGLF